MGSKYCKHSNKCPGHLLRPPVGDEGGGRLCRPFMSWVGILLTSEKGKKSFIIAGVFIMLFTVTVLFHAVHMLEFSIFASDITLQQECEMWRKHYIII